MNTPRQFMMGSICVVVLVMSMSRTAKAYDITVHVSQCGKPINVNAVHFSITPGDNPRSIAHSNLAITTPIRTGTYVASISESVADQNWGQRGAREQEVFGILK